MLCAHPTEHINADAGSVQSCRPEHGEVTAALLRDLAWTGNKIEENVKSDLI